MVSDIGNSGLMVRILAILGHPLAYLDESFPARKSPFTQGLDEVSIAHCLHPDVCDLPACSSVEVHNFIQKCLPCVFHTNCVPSRYSRSTIFNLEVVSALGGKFLKIGLYLFKFFHTMPND